MDNVMGTALALLWSSKLLGHGEGLRALTSRVTLQLLRKSIVHSEHV